MGQLKFNITNTPAKEVFRLINEVRLICMYKNAIMYCHSKSEVEEWLGPLGVIENVTPAKFSEGVNWFGLTVNIYEDHIYVLPGTVKVHFE